MAAKKESKNTVATAPAGDKKAALETALAQIEKQFGKGAVMSWAPTSPCRWIPSPPAAWGWIWRWASAVCARPYHRNLRA